MNAFIYLRRERWEREGEISYGKKKRREQAHKEQRKQEKESGMSASRVLLSDLQLEKPGSIVSGELAWKSRGCLDVLCKGKP